MTGVSPAPAATAQPPNRPTARTSRTGDPESNTARAHRITSARAERTGIDRNLAVPHPAATAVRRWRENRPWPSAKAGGHLCTRSRRLPASRASHAGASARRPRAGPSGLSRADRSSFTLPPAPNELLAQASPSCWFDLGEPRGQWPGGLTLGCASARSAPSHRSRHPETTPLQVRRIDGITPTVSTVQPPRQLHRDPFALATNAKAKISAFRCVRPCLHLVYWQQPAPSSFRATADDECGGGRVAQCTPRRQYHGTIERSPRTSITGDRHGCTGTTRACGNTSAPPTHGSEDVHTC